MCTEMCVSLHVKHLLNITVQLLTKIKTFGQILTKLANTKFHNTVTELLYMDRWTW